MSYTPQDLNLINNSIDDILFDLHSTTPLTDKDMLKSIDYCTTLIHTMLTATSKSYDQASLKLIITDLIINKHKRLYIYDNTSYLNNVGVKYNSNCILTHDAQGNFTGNNKPFVLRQLKQLVTDTTLAHPTQDDIKQLDRMTSIIKHLQSIKQHEQKSIEWLNQRKECITATKIVTALGQDPYASPLDLILDKCNRGPPFIDNVNTHHGRKYEEIGNMFYSFRNSVPVDEYGLLQHPIHSFIGASPDGICGYTSNSSISGRMIEIKFPRTRNINVTTKIDDGVCPHYYYLQVLTQLYVTGLDECDFIQFKVNEYENWDAYVNDTNLAIPTLSKVSGLEKGFMIQLFKKQCIMNPIETSKDDTLEQANANPLLQAKYVYMPKLHMTNSEIKAYVFDYINQFNTTALSKDYIIDKVIYWRLDKAVCTLIKSDTPFFESIIPTLKQFWDYVVFFREHGDKLDGVLKLNEMLQQELEDNQDVNRELFQHVFQVYNSASRVPHTTALYQSRHKFNHTHAH
ncbi:YqaJ viral recombinase [uncultured virus]|nr:YqaJ viral recombinase [uncultured virus]